MSEDKISQEDLNKLKELRTIAGIAQINAEKAASEAKVAMLERQGYIQHMFLRLGLSINDTIDENTGEIKRVNTSVPVDTESVENS